MNLTREMIPYSPVDKQSSLALRPSVPIAAPAPRHLLPFLKSGGLCLHSTVF